MVVATVQTLLPSILVLALLHKFDTTEGVQSFVPCETTVTKDRIIMIFLSFSSIEKNTSPSKSGTFLAYITQSKRKTTKGHILYIHHEWRWGKLPLLGWDGTVDCKFSSSEILEVVEWTTRGTKLPPSCADENTRTLPSLRVRKNTCSNRVESYHGL